MARERVEQENDFGVEGRRSSSDFQDGVSPPLNQELRYSDQTLAAPYISDDAEKSSLEEDYEKHSTESQRHSSSDSIIPSQPPQPPTNRTQSHISHARSNADAQPESEKENKDAQNSQDKDPNLIDWAGPGDPENPQNFSTARKWIMTSTLGMMTFCITFASSVFSTATMATAQEFHISPEVMILGTSLFVLGFAVGPPIWGPLSELYGRKIPLFAGFFIFAIFQIPVAVAQNLETIMLFRFLGGVFGSAPLGIVGGQLTDFWGPVDRGVAMTIFCGATFIGPVAGPIAGGFIVDSYLGWRWTAWLTAILAFSICIIAFFIVPETFPPVLLSRRAAKLRFETKNWAIHSKQDEQKVDMEVIIEKYFSRPFKMLVQEPILILVTLYMSLVYGILYLFFEAYPIAFQEERGWNSGVGALPFLSILLGVVLGGVIIIYFTKTRFARFLEKEGRVVPEERLIPMIIGGFLFPAGMFWFAWTSSPHITWVPQVLAGIPIGAGVVMIFLQGLNYIIDVYLMYANSAIAANTFLRSGFGAGFPLFATAMFHRLGVNWATSLLGFLTAALFPVPILFYIYGLKIRKMSKYAPT